MNNTEAGRTRNQSLRQDLLEAEELITGVWFQLKDVSPAELWKWYQANRSDISSDLGYAMGLISKVRRDIPL